jgi:lysyl-tRNA synthetase class 2
MNIPDFNEIVEQNDQTEARREHLEKLRALVGNVYPNKFERSRVSGTEDTISSIVHFAPVVEIVKELKDATPEGEKPDQELKAGLNEKLKAFGSVRVSGRMAVPPRVMGKAAFVHLSDGKERLQIYVRRDDAKVVFNGATSVPSAVADGLNAGDNPPATAGGTDKTGAAGGSDSAAWEVFKLLDHGDFIGAEGYLFLTNTGELSVHVETFQFLAKAMLPMPDKMHGIADPELRRRFRYADLIASSLQVEHEGLTTREVFERRAKMISGMRRFLEDHGYIEVETPMLTPKATGAAAEPFETFHKALGIPLYARIAPELYLKRLVVGGFEKVYELNRNFRNEGLSHKHSPEFTMLEFYCAYMDVNGMMDFAEEMIKESVKEATGGSLTINYDGNEIDFSKFERLTMKQAIIKNLPWYFEYIESQKIDETFLEDSSNISQLYEFYSLVEKETDKEHKEHLEQHHKEDAEQKYGIDYDIDKHSYQKIAFFIIGQKDVGSYWQRAKLIANNKPLDENNVARQIEELFDALAEPNLIHPTFITDYPKSISPLSKASPENPNIAERFELFIAGAERANGFSELNDPQEQYDRFVDQMKERQGGDKEAMIMDEDYIRALSYGMPPAAGIGIGIDRLVMLLTNQHSIRDVILFPHMRPEKKDGETERQSDAETEN